MRKKYLMVMVMVSLFLLTTTAVAAADDDDTKYDTFTYIDYYHGITSDQGFFAGVDIISVDSKKGELFIHVKNQESTCEDTYRISWSFSKDLQTIKLGDSFTVDYSSEFIQGTCPEGYLVTHVDVFTLHGSEKVIGNYRRNCEGELRMSGTPSGDWRAYPGNPQRKNFTDARVLTYSNRPQPCAYGDIMISVGGRGMWYELSYLYLSYGSISEDPTSSPPATQNVGICDSACQDQAQVKVNWNELEVDFNYTSPVNILVGLLSSDFMSTWWLDSGCQFKEGFSVAGSSTMSLVCPNIAVPAAAANGYVFWMVVEEDFATLNWTTGIYELLFYSIQ